jgi:hypothetical protein
MTKLIRGLAATLYVTTGERVAELVGSKVQLEGLIGEPVGWYR